MFGLITEEASVVVLVTVVVVAVPLPWVTLTQHDEDGDSPSIVAAAATTVFVRHRETSERDGRTRTENRVEKERRRGRERGRHREKEKPRKPRDPAQTPRRARARTHTRARVYQRRELDTRANSRDTSLAAVMAHTCRVHLALSRSINPDRSGPSYRGNLIPWEGEGTTTVFSVPVLVPAPRSFSPFTRNSRVSVRTRDTRRTRCRDSVTRNLAALSPLRCHSFRTLLTRPPVHRSSRRPHTHATRRTHMRAR